MIIWTDKTKKGLCSARWRNGYLLVFCKNFISVSSSNNEKFDTENGDSLFLQNFYSIPQFDNFDIDLHCFCI